jgi:hypothetical protein
MDLVALQTSLNSCRNYTLHSICELFDLRRYGTKNDMVSRIMAYIKTASSFERGQLMDVLRDSGNQANNNSPPNPRISPSAIRVARKSHPLLVNQNSETHVFSNPEQNEALRLLFSSIDPFHPIAPIPNPFLICSVCRSGSTSFNIEIPDLRNWRRQGYSVWLRCISKTASKNDRHIWPKAMSVFSNLSQVAKVDEPKKLKKRRDEPIDFTPFLQSGRNHIQISVTDSRPSDFTIALLVCCGRTNSNLTNSIREESRAACLGRVREILKIKSDLLVEDNRRLDLRCPITLERISNPARGSECSHLRCFDLNAFMDVNRQTSNINQRWKCPICYKLILPESIVKDMYVKEILDSTRRADSEVLLDDGTGNWKTVESSEVDDYDDDETVEEEILYRTEGPEIPRNNVEVVNLDDSSDEEPPPLPPFKIQRFEPIVALPPPVPTKSLDIIELD